MKENFLNDLPASTDEFKRRPFASLIAKRLSAGEPNCSVVVSVHGPAGEGKTTLLRFICDALGNHPNVICVEFNPWHVDSSAQLPQALLATLADGLRDRTGTTPSHVDETLRDYAAFFTSPAGNDDARPVNRHSAVKASLAKTAVDNALADSGACVVVLMDDVDRLDAEKLQALLRLLKGTADFSSVSYVLAGDNHLMADTLSRAVGRPEAGREFLDKAIQIPLGVPKADPDLLREYFLRRLKDALDPSAVSVRADAEARFSEMFLQGLQIRIKTPRTAKRYVNALAFALGMLKARVNTVDLIVLEGIRLLYPSLYRHLRENRDDFLWYRISRDGPDADNRATELLQLSSAGLSLAEAEAVQFLVKALFPAFDRSRYPSRGDIERWSDDKRVCSPEHFDRFFDYGGEEK